MSGLSVVGKGINPITHSDSAPSETLLKPKIGSNSAKPTKSSAEARRKERIAEADKKLKIAADRFSPQKGLEKMEREVVNAEVNHQPGAEKIASNGLSFLVVIGTNAATLAKAAVDVVKARVPPAVDEAIQELKKGTEKKDQKKDQSGGGGALANVKKYSKIFVLTILPASLSLLISIFLLIVLIWGTIQWILTTINENTGSNMSVPNITFDKKITQTVYSIFFVITSLFLMFYLLIDYFRKVGPELDIIQILKQVIGALYILWPIAVLIIGSGIAKAFYKISCNGNKPNVLSWAKIVESSVLYVLGMTILIMVILLLKPIKYLYETYLHKYVKKRFDRLTDLVRVTLKLMVIYILLRMVSIMIENVISNKLVFFISKLNKNVEAPPVNCNAEEEEQKTKQSELARILEQIYMYISGFIVCVFIIFILIVQCPHPWTPSTYKINDNIGTVLLRFTDILTRFIVENKYGKIDYNKQKNGSSFLSSLTGSVGKGAEVPPSDSTGSDNSGIAGYMNKFKNAAETFKPSGEQFVSQANNTSNDGKLGELGKILTQPAPNTPDGPADGSAGEEFLNGLRQQASTSTPPQGRNSAVQPDLMRSQGLTKPNRPTLPEAFSGEAGRVSGETSYPSGVTYDPRDTPKKIYGKGDPSTRPRITGERDIQQLFLEYQKHNKANSQVKKNHF